MPETQNQNPLPPENEAVLKHIDMFQGIITRMASNSSACKNWCIVLVSAYLAYAANNGKLNYIELSAIPVVPADVCPIMKPLKPCNPTPPQAGMKAKMA